MKQYPYTCPEASAEPFQVRPYNLRGWDELWIVIEYRRGCVYKTKPTGFHIHRNQPLPETHTRVSINAKPTDEWITINPFLQQTKGL
jgi:hypothetical protein